MPLSQFLIKFIFSELYFSCIIKRRYVRSYKIFRSSGVERKLLKNVMLASFDLWETFSEFQLASVLSPLCWPLWLDYFFKFGHSQKYFLPSWTNLPNSYANGLIPFMCFLTFLVFYKHNYGCKIRLRLCTILNKVSGWT